MMYWVREIVGWLFIVLGLITFWVVYSSLLSQHKFFEAGPMTLIGIFLFRGGIHLLKVAVAAHMPASRASSPQAAGNAEQVIFGNIGLKAWRISAQG